ncbi:Retrotransposon gag protein [Popillia japonica]|uniref:Retrotransposon gag protein n=1 Tax=Popillia japonica TaxID=7064 RepID=A0AAW1LYX6_POPJA
MANNSVSDDRTPNLPDSNETNALPGKAREQIDVHCDLTTWESISALLISLYQDKKSLDQLLEELSNMRQSNSETVSKFYQRLKDLTSRILGIIYTTEDKEDKLKGRILMIQDMALNRFIYHTHSSISQMLRYREFKSINAALTAATEEKALRLTYRSSSSRCRNCGRNNHDTRDCNGNKQPAQKSINFNKSVRQNNNNDPVSAPKQCRYCKKLGHVIEGCRKRQYNNNMREQTNSKPNTSRPNPHPINFQQNFPRACELPKPPERVEQITQNLDRFAM